MGGCFLKENADFAQQEYPHLKPDRSGRFFWDFSKDKKIRRGGMAGRTRELARHDDRWAEFEINVADVLQILAENAV